MQHEFSVSVNRPNSLLVILNGEDPGGMYLGGDPGGVNDSSTFSEDTSDVSVLVHFSEQSSRSVVDAESFCKLLLKVWSVSPSMWVAVETRVVKSSKVEGVIARLWDR